VLAGIAALLRRALKPSRPKKGKTLRILVTGGAGFIGSHVAGAYAAAGHELLVVDSLWEHGGGRRVNVPNEVTLVHMDIRDEAIGRVFADFKPDVVSHHAAQHSVAISARDPIYDAQVNVVGLLNVLEHASRSGARKIVFAGSGAIYGTPESLPMNEETPQRPSSPYGITKMVAEHYLRFYRANRGLDFTVLRYGNVYGPRQDPNGEAGVISIFIGRFLARRPVRIDWDGEQTRDYVYVADVAAANVASLERGSGESYVIGTGRRTSVNEIYRTLVAIGGFEVPIERAPQRPGDARDAQFDSAKACAELGWTPATALADGVAATYEYFERLPPGY
jgi:UDP-glucose 4-epimerase